MEGNFDPLKSSLFIVSLLKCDYHER
jgi:hypothetical protein